MPRGTWPWRRDRQAGVVHPLLPPAWRPAAAVVAVAGAALVAVIGVLVRHQPRAGWLDAAVGSWVQHGIGGHPQVLNQISNAGDPLPVTVMSGVLVLACLLTRRWLGAALVAISVPAASVLTEHVLKPLVGRTLGGALTYPSGHSTAVFTVAAVIAVLLASPRGQRRLAAARLLAAAAALLAAAVVAVSLVGMDIHYFTDTIGGAATGIAVVALTALSLDWAVARRPWSSSRQHPVEQVRVPQ